MSSIGYHVSSTEAMKAIIGLSISISKRPSSETPMAAGFDSTATERVSTSIVPSACISAYNLRYLLAIHFDWLMYARANGDLLG